MDMKAPCIKRVFLATVVLSIISAATLMVPRHALAQEVSTYPEPVVAIHVSELTQALETMPAKPPTPPAGPDTTGYEWAYTSWHYFVAYESLKEALRSDGTPFVEISDADIISGKLLQTDGSPRYPILISLASEAVSDAEIGPLRNYVNVGGSLLIGSSAFTRNPDGTMRDDFALANEMGVHVVDPSLDNWDENMKFTKVLNHPLVSGIPSGTLNWRMPLTSEEIPIQGIDPNPVIHGNHLIWRVNAADATVIARGSSTPLLTIKNYGKGTFIYHSVFQPLIGHGGFDSGMYAYLIYRNAIEGAFESANEPVIRLSPWRYQYDAAFIVRHDFENLPDLIRSIETSAAFESSRGAHGEYYFCTGTLRDQMADKNTVISSLRRAVSNYGASIGPHNGGLKNPLYPSMSPSAYDYWHWGPDDVLDVTPSGYANGKAYAQASIAKSFGDIGTWLAGVDNGRSGCGSAGTCPRIWASPKFNSTRENSYDLLAGLNAVTVGEQKVSPFPHWTVSTQTAGRRYEHVTLPVSDWYRGSDVLQALDDHTSSTMRAAVDFYYSLGALINLYGHAASASGTLQGEYVTYCAAKPSVWATNSVGVYDWWRIRSNLSVTPSYTRAGETAIARAVITGATDSDTAVEIAIPGLNGDGIAGLQVFLNGSPATSNDYRITKDGVKVKVGASFSDVEVRYLTVQAAPLSITTASLPGGTVGVAYLATLTASGGTTPYTWLIPSGLPPGLTLNSSTGAISGTPTTVGTYSFTAQVADSSNPVLTATKVLSIGVVAPSPALTSIAVTPANQTIQVGATQQFTATGTYSNGSTQNITGSVTWTSSNTSVATITGAGLATAVNPGSTTIMATLSGVSGSAGLTVQAASLTITTASLSNGTQNVSYSAALTASGGTTPYTWLIPSGLPPGLTLNSSTGAITGTPTSVGTYSFTAQVTDAGNPAQNATKALSIVISAPQTSYTIWSGTAVPGVVDAGADSPLELGVKFKSDVAGTITGIRFYKASTNTGTHIGTLWSSNGTKLATATFTGETASGWQQVNFATPVAISANTVYVASYHTNVGHYGFDEYYFATAGVDNPPLHALADGVSGGNGVYRYGSNSIFPNQSWHASHAWVDVVFSRQ
jgi:hypothetical protein